MRARFFVWEVAASGSGKVPRFVSRGEVAIGGKGHSLRGEQVQFPLELRAGSFTGVTPDVQIVPDDTMAGHLRSEWIPPERLPDGLT
jgi:hypothetical protein